MRDAAAIAKAATHLSSGLVDCPATLDGVGRQANSHVVTMIYRGALAVLYVLVLFNAGAYIAMLPHVSGDFGVSPSFGTWTQNDFMVGLAVGIPLAGGLARRWGTQWAFSVGTTAFAAASVGCVVTQDFGVFLLCRFLLGVGGGAAFPAAERLFMETFPTPMRVHAAAAWGVCTLSPFSIGTTCGGWLADGPGWRGLFVLNAALGVLAFVAVHLRQPPPENPRRAMDWPGYLLFALILMVAQTLLNQGNDWDWLDAAWIRTLALVLGVAGVSWLAWWYQSAQPFFDLRLLRSRNALIGLVSLAIGFLCFQGLLSLLIVQLQSLLGYSSTAGGLVFLPMALCAMPLSILLQTRVSPRNAHWLASLGFFGFAMSYFWISRFDQSSAYYALFLPKLLEGVCLGLFFLPLNTLMLQDLPAEHHDQMRSFANTVRTASGATGISLVNIVLYRQTPFHQSHFVEQLTSFDANTALLTERFLSRGFSPPLATRAAMGFVTKHSAIMGISDAFFCAGGLCLLLGFILVCFAGPQRLKPDVAAISEKDFA